MTAVRRINFQSLTILFCITFCLKLGLAFYFAANGHCGAANRNVNFINQVGAISFTGGDTFSYLGAIDNLITENEYYFRYGEKKVYAGRMPYYGVPYFLLRQIFEKNAAADWLVVAQILFGSLAAIFFARLCFKLTNGIWCFWLGYAAYLSSFNSFTLDLLLVPESFALGLTVLFLYFYYQYRTEKKSAAFWTASVFLALLTLLKPYFVLLYPFFFVDLAIALQIFRLPFQRIKVVEFASKSFASGLILIVLLLPWAARNFIVLDKIIFSQENVYAGYDYKKADLAFLRFTAAWGGDFIGWNPQSKNPTYYFSKDYAAIHDQIKLPSTAFADGYGAAEIERVRQDYLRLQNDYSPELDASVTAQFDDLTAIYRRERPFMYYVGSGFVAAKRFLLHTNSQNLLSFINAENPCYRSWQIIFRIVNAAVYLASILFGFVGIAFLSIKKNIGIIYAAVPFFLIAYFAFYDGHADARYFYPATPVLLLGTIFVLNCLLSKIKRAVE